MEWRGGSSIRLCLFRVSLTDDVAYYSASVQNNIEKNMDVACQALPINLFFGDFHKQNKTIIVPRREAKLRVPYRKENNLIYTCVNIEQQSFLDHY